MSNEARETDEGPEAGEHSGMEGTDSSGMKPKLTDPAYMKTEAELEIQVAYVKRVCKNVSIVLGIAIALLIGAVFLAI